MSFQFPETTLFFDVCKGCHRSFQWNYTYRAWLPEVKERIDTQTCNGSGIRDISRNLGISKTTVMADLKKKDSTEVNVAYANYLKTHTSAGIDVEICTEGDEFWSDVHDKSYQQWTWYVLERTSGAILAHHNDRRTDAACQALLKRYDMFGPVQFHYCGKKVDTVGTHMARCS